MLSFFLFPYSVFALFLPLSEVAINAFEFFFFCFVRFYLSQYILNSVSRRYTKSYLQMLGNLTLSERLSLITVWFRAPSILSSVFHPFRFTSASPSSHPPLLPQPHPSLWLLHLNPFSFFLNIVLHNSTSFSSHDLITPSPPSASSCDLITLPSFILLLTWLHCITWPNCMSPAPFFYHPSMTSLQPPLLHHPCMTSLHPDSFIFCLESLHCRSQICYWLQWQVLYSADWLGTGDCETGSYRANARDWE